MPTNFTHQERLSLLNNLTMGRPNAVGAKKLAGLIGFPQGGNQPKLRRLIKECIEVDGDLIGAAIGRPAGFFLIGTLQELESYLDSLGSRAISDNERRSALITNWNSNNAINTSRNPLIIT
ncbi:MAG: hypothetical protein ABI203_01225 [Mucilaginibacter sp.]